MKHLKPIAIACLLLVSCGKKFPDVMKKAETEFAKKDYVDTVDTLNNGISLWREDDGGIMKGRAYEMLGKSYHQLRNTEKAIEAFEVAIKASTNTFDSAYTMGSIYLAQNHPGLAQKSFETALRMNPKDPLALLGLGNSLFLQKKTAEAGVAFQKVLDVSPGVHEALESLALIRSRGQRPAVVHRVTHRRR